MALLPEDFNQIVAKTFLKEVIVQYLSYGEKVTMNDLEKLLQEA